MIKLPENIQKDMDYYRNNMVSIPKSYIEFHENLANIDMIKQGFDIIENHGLVSDGWFDGNKVVQLVIKDGDESITIRWDESGAWFKKGAGWSRYKEMVA